jgi:hypothetical protein
VASPLEASKERPLCSQTANVVSRLCTQQLVETGKTV